MQLQNTSLICMRNLTLRAHMLTSMSNLKLIFIPTPIYTHKLRAHPGACTVCTRQTKSLIQAGAARTCAAHTHTHTHAHTHYQCAKVGAGASADRAHTNLTLARSTPMLWHARWQSAHKTCARTPHPCSVLSCHTIRQHACTQTLHATTSSSACHDIRCWCTAPAHALARTCCCRCCC